MKLEPDPRRKPDKRTPLVRLLCVLAIALAAPCLSGSTARWSQAIVLCAAGVLFFLFPPRRSAGKLFNIVAVGLLLLSATAFLPAEWFGVPGWRTALVEDYGIRLPGTLSLQPWLTLDATVLFMAGIAWAYYLAVQQWGERDREILANGYCAGIIALTAVAIAGYLTGSSPWQSQWGFGPFYNRNVTGSLLGISGVMLLACGSRDIERGRKTWLLWLGGLVLVAVGLIFNLSRAGIALFFGCCFAWTACVFWLRTSARHFVIAASCLLVLLAVFLLFGGRTLDRFRLESEPAFAFRWAGYVDSLALGRVSPWCGIGLGNFEDVFAMFRNESLVEDVRIDHPENDWILLRVEMGWVAVLLVAAGCALLAARIFPLKSGSSRSLRLAGALAAAGFLAHGMVEISGHDFGAVIPAIFLFSLALQTEPGREGGRILPWAFRALGIVLAATGAFWLIACRPGAMISGPLGVAASESASAEAMRERRWDDVIRLTESVIEREPLNWRLYFIRAVALTNSSPDWRNALGDFRRARFLAPESSNLAFAEGQVWAAHRQTALALAAWREALRRAPQRRREIYNRILATEGHKPWMAPGLQGLAGNDIDLHLVYHRTWSGREEFTNYVEALMKSDPALNTISKSQRSELFSIWAEKGDRAELARLIESHDEWLPEGWRFLAEHLAKKGNYEEAYAIARRFIETPVLPPAPVRRDIAALQREFYADPRNYPGGYALFRAYIESDQTADAIAVLQKLKALPDCPKYLHFVEAELWAGLSDWERAFEALDDFER